MAMRQHDAIRPKDRVDGRYSGKKRMDRRIKFICPFDLADESQRRTNPRVEISPYSVIFIIPLPGKLVR